MALAAWTFAYAGIFDPSFIESEVMAHYGSRRLLELMPGVRGGRTFFEVAVEDGRVLGLCCANVTGRSVQLHRLYLDPTALGRGLATEFLARLRRYATANGAWLCFCFVHKHNERGKAFYLKQGFVHLPSRDTAEDWRMVKVVRDGLTGRLARLWVSSILRRSRGASRHQRA